MKTDPNNSFLKGMTRQLTGVPFEDFFNNLGNFKIRKNLKPPPTQSEAVMEVVATSQETITVATIKTLLASKAQKDCRVWHQCYEIAYKGDIDPVVGRDEEIIPYREIHQPSNQNNRF